MSTASAPLTMARLMAMTQEELVELWESLPAPSAGELNGEYTGHLALNGLTAEQEAWALQQMCDETSELGSWIGKRYDGSETVGEGYNVWRKVGPEYVSSLRFKTELLDDAFGRGPALVMYYGTYSETGNDLVDLVRRAAPGIYVGIGFRTSGEPLGPIFGASAFLMSGPTRPWVPFDQPTT
jgi:hypothetical protein